MHRAAERADVIALDPIEVILALGVDEPEHRIGIGMAMNMRNAPVITGDRDGLGFGLPARRVIDRGLLR